MNILITGAFGFVGTNLSKAIKTNPGHHLIAVDIFEPENHLYDEFYHWKSLKKINKNMIDAIIHLAGKAHDTENLAESKSYFQINLGLTQQIFKYFKNSSADKFIFFSSVKAVADEVPNEQLTEDAIPDPRTPYGMSKLAAEQFIKDFRLSEKKKIYILRPAMIHGPGNKGNLNLLYSVVKKGVPWPLGAFNNQRSFTSIENLCFIIQKIINSDIPSGIYNIADNEPVSTNRLIELISEVRGSKAKIMNVNPGVIKGMSRLGDLLHLPLNSLRLQKLTENYVVSNEKIKTALGLDKLPISPEGGLIRTLKSFND